MVLQPHSLEELCALLAGASARRQPIERADLSALRGVVEHFPEDMTATVRADTPLAEFQAALARHHQWLPIDPPVPETLSIGQLLARNWSGPRRLGFGPIREYLIGIQVVLGDGTLIKAGGKVVKNVAGYDLGKLFIGARDSLGLIVEATFKLRPLPEREAILHLPVDSLGQLAELRQRIHPSSLQPIALDLHNLDPGAPFRVVAAFAGAAEDVEQQAALAQDEFGFQDGGSFSSASAFWQTGPAPSKVSVLPSATLDTLRRILPAPFLARWGNGVIYHRGSAATQAAPLPLALMQRLKQAWDPARILPEYHP